MGHMTEIDREAERLAAKHNAIVDAKVRAGRLSGRYDRITPHTVKAMGVEWTEREIERLRAKR